MIPYGRQNITDEDIQSVSEALRSDFLTQGPRIKEFEDAFAAYIGSRYAVAVSNGTAALHLSALALRVKPGSKVITTPITFAASANCIRYCGGEVVFSDIQPDSYLLDVEGVRSLLQSSPAGTYQGIIPVDFAGRSADMETFRKLADEYGLWIIEDSCHAPGGFFVDSRGEKHLCGNGKFADLAIFSFHPVKHIACGEGGMITTNSFELYQKLLVLRTHGITRDADHFTNDVSFANGDDATDKYPPWYMEMQTLGYNYRLTDFQAALGVSQLKKADKGLARRGQIAMRYNDAFAGKDFLIGQSGVVQGHAYHLYVVEVENRLGLYNFLRQKNVFAQIHYIPCHLMPYYRKFGWKPGDLLRAENYYKRCLSLPMYPTLTEEEQAYVIDQVIAFYNRR
jgi:UDP-4-amino-4,6-dideoxy-N-acetyl-beta-L-altrosamine transaminase